MNVIGIKVNCITYVSVNTDGGETKSLTTTANKMSCYATTLGNATVLVTRHLYMLSEDVTYFHGSISQYILDHRSI
jgi:hypothetical protein